MNVGHCSRLHNCYMLEQLVELGIVLDGQEDVARRDTLLAKRFRRIARQLEHLGAQVLDHTAHHHARRLVHDPMRIELFHVLDNSSHRKFFKINNQLKLENENK